MGHGSEVGRQKNLQPKWWQQKQIREIKTPNRNNHGDCRGREGVHGRRVKPWNCRSGWGKYLPWAISPFNKGPGSITAEILGPLGYRIEADMEGAMEDKTPQFWGHEYTLDVKDLHLALEPLKDIITIISTYVMFKLISSMRL